MKSLNIIVWTACVQGGGFVGMAVADVRGHRSKVSGLGALPADERETPSAMSSHYLLFWFTCPLFAQIGTHWSSSLRAKRAQPTTASFSAELPMVGRRMRSRSGGDYRTGAAVMLPTLEKLFEMPDRLACDSWKAPRDEVTLLVLACRSGLRCGGTMYNRWLLIVLVLWGVASDALADHLVLNSGRVYEGEILQEGDSSITFRLDHGIITIPRTVVSSIDRSPPAPVVKPASPAPAAAPRVTQRIPNWQIITSTLAKQPWATNLKQIPSTVVDKGAMRFVPYASYRCGEDYEVNVYGDPDAPACIEIGVYHRLLRDDTAKSRCVDLIASALPDAGDAAIVKALRRTKDMVVRDGITFEITPETDEDAYGGWWVSVYSQKALDAARATEDELKNISVAKSAVEQSPGPTTTNATPRSIAGAADQSETNSTANATAWSNTDMTSARSTGASSGGGRVYVRGYYRKNGTYVAPHTRSTPRH